MNANQQIIREKPYVYYHRLPNSEDIFYVGCGKNERYAAVRGRTPLWHKIVAEAGGFIPEVIQWFDSTEDAHVFEIAEIKRLKPRANVVGNSNFPKKGIPKDLFIETTNIRVYKSTHKKLQELAKKKRQQMIVVVDELIK